MDECSLPGCSRPLDHGAYRLPEDRHQAEPPEYCSAGCAANARLQRKWARKELRFDAQRASL